MFIRRFVSLLLLAVFASPVFSQNLFDTQVVQKIEIQFSFSNWDFRLDSAEAGADEFIVADWVKINGVQLDSVGVKWRGNTTFDPAQNKNPLHLELNHVKIGVTYDGQNDLYLNNGKSDPAFIREALTAEILKKYMATPRAGFAEVWINGLFWGLYSIVEEVGGGFVKANFGSSKGAFFKCSPENPGIDNLANLAYLGPQKQLYYPKYEKRAVDDATWDELVDLCDTLSNKTSAVEKILDVDRCLWMLSANNVLVNLNSYTGGFSENYYVYRNEWGRFCPIPYDLGESFGGFPLLNPPIPMTATDLENLPPLAQEANVARPLIQRLLLNATFRKMYVAHLRTIFSENIDNGQFAADAQAMQDLIQPKVASDVHKFYGLGQFLSSLSTTHVSATSGFNIPGISSLMNARRTFLLSHPEVQKTPPSIELPVVSPAAPKLGTFANFTTKTTNATTVWLGWRTENFAPFTRQPMYDDGLHSDGAAGDGTFGSSLFIEVPTTQFYIWAENAEAGAFSPARAEYEFHTLAASVNLIPPGSVVVNEVMASNMTTFADPAGQFDDWIELHNRSANEVNLSRCWLTNKLAEPQKWAFPDGTKIAAGGYLVIWADEDTGQSGLHTNFKLKIEGDQVKLTDEGLNPIDSVDFNTQTTDVAWARIPNGTGPFQFQQPTPGANNSPMATDDFFEKTGLRLFPNPTNGLLFVDGNFEPDAVFEIFNSLGQQVLRAQIGAGNGLDLTGLPAGFYFLKMENGRVAGRILKS